MRAEAAGRRWEEHGIRAAERRDFSPPVGEQQHQHQRQSRKRLGRDGLEDVDSDEEEEEADEPRGARILSPVAEEVGGVVWFMWVIYVMRMVGWVGR